MKKELSIIIPVYNEKGAIEETIHQVLALMKKTNIKHELILVNDGSVDGSGEIIQKYLRKNRLKNVFLCNHTHNRGYGASLKTGISKAKYNNICITDADATYPNERIPEMLDIYLEGSYDMVVGKRPFKKLPTLTKPAKIFLTSLASYLAGKKIDDINSGLRIFRKDVITKFFNIISEGFSFTTTSTLAMITNGYNIRYIDIDYLKRKGKSKIHPIRDTLNFVQIIIRTVLYFNPLKIFVPLSLILLFLGIAVFVAGLPSGLKLKTPFVVLFVSSIHMLSIGMIADLIDKRIPK
jgi:glycosyltransferase involved in cell wall biosynthesis